MEEGGASYHSNSNVASLVVGGEPQRRSKPLPLKVNKPAGAGTDLEYASAAAKSDATPKPTSISWGMRRKVAVSTSPSRKSAKKKGEAKSSKGSDILGQDFVIMGAACPSDAAVDVSVNSSIDRYSEEFRSSCQRASKENEALQQTKVTTTYRRAKSRIKVRSTKTSRARERLHHGAAKEERAAPFTAVSSSRERKKKSKRRVEAGSKPKSKRGPLAAARVAKLVDEDRSDADSHTSASTIASFIERFRHAPPTSPTIRREQRRAGKAKNSGGGGAAHSKLWWHDDVSSSDSRPMWSYRRPKAEGIDIEDAKIRVLQRKAQNMLEAHEERSPDRILFDQEFGFDDEGTDIHEAETEAEASSSSKVDEAVRNLKLEDPDTLIARLRARLYPEKHEAPPLAPTSRAALSADVPSDGDLLKESEEDPESMVARIRDRLYGKIPSAVAQSAVERKSVDSLGHGSFALSVSTVGSGDDEQVARFSFAISPDASLTFEPGSSHEKLFAQASRQAENDSNREDEKMEEELRGLRLLSSSADLRESAELPALASSSNETRDQSSPAPIGEIILPSSHGASDASNGQPEAATQVEILRTASDSSRMVDAATSPIWTSASPKRSAEERLAETDVDTDADLSVDTPPTSPSLGPDSPLFRSPHLKHLKDELSPLVDKNEAGVLEDAATADSIRTLKRRSSWPQKARRRSFPRSPMLFSPHLKHLKDGEDSKEMDVLRFKKSAKRSPPTSPLSKSPINTDSEEERTGNQVAELQSPMPPAPPPLPPEFALLSSASLETACDGAMKGATPARYHRDMVWRMLRADVLRCQINLRAFELELLESHTL